MAMRDLRERKEIWAKRRRVAQTSGRNLGHLSAQEHVLARTMSRMFEQSSQYVDAFKRGEELHEGLIYQINEKERELLNELRATHQTEVGTTERAKRILSEMTFGEDWYYAGLNRKVAFATDMIRALDAAGKKSKECAACIPVIDRMSNSIRLQLGLDPPANEVIKRALFLLYKARKPSPKEIMKRAVSAWYKGNKNISESKKEKKRRSSGPNLLNY